jgi:hypothetical protein
MGGGCSRADGVPTLVGGVEQSLLVQDPASPGGAGAPLIEKVRFAEDSPLEEAVSSEPVSGARPPWRSGDRAVKPGGGGAIKKQRINPTHLLSP